MKMNNENRNEFLDLGSEPVDENFDPFAPDDEESDAGGVTEEISDQPMQASTSEQAEEPALTSEPIKTEAPAKEQPKTEPTTKATTAAKISEAEQALDEKPPVFVLNGVE